MNLVFVRHGESLANREGWLAGHQDPPLTEQGRTQARALAAELAPRPFGRAWTSDLSRARETAEIVLAGRPVPLEVLPVLRERHLGDWEGASRERLRATGGLDLLMSWDGRPPGGESHRDVALRLIDWLAALPEGPPGLVVAHGALLRAALGLHEGRTPDEIGRWSLGNCHRIEVEEAPEHWVRLRRRLLTGTP